ncbi:MAG: hypothetical protein WCX81_03330 [Monoglobales bacterium]
MIKDKKTLTLFRYDSELCEWKSFYIKNALIHNCRGIHEGLRGIKYSGQSIIRVRLKNPEDIYCGDKIAVGIHKGECPADAMTVTAVTDNNKGTSYVRHLKITCEG